MVPLIDTQSRVVKAHMEQTFSDDNFFSVRVILGT